MSQRLSLGISENRDFSYPDIPAEAFKPNGRYRPALLKLQTLTSSRNFEKWAKAYWERCLNAGGTLPAANFEGARDRFKAGIAWILVYEAEHARIWAEGPPDYRETLRRYQRQAYTDSNRIKAAIEEMKRFDRKHAYLLRHSVQHAMQDFLSDSETRKARLPNPNTKKGFDTVTVSGPEVRHSEFQFLSRLSFFQFDNFLESWCREIDALFSEGPAHWKEFGALRFGQPLSRVAAAKLNVVQLGLIARLTARLRDFTAGHDIRAYSTNQPIPAHGKPCWEIVAEFVNCALGSERHLTGDTARRIWQNIAAKHAITMQAWPCPPKAESRMQKNSD